MTTHLTIAAVGRLTPVLQVTVNPCYAELDAWKAAIEEEIDAQPLPSCLESAYLIGQTDRMLGFDSRSHTYEDDELRMAYVAGYAAKRLLSDKEMQMELEEYRDDMEDRLYWAGGSW